ncbi:Uncharacterised protein [Salmonella enterica subsp. enterica serovar Bovismorbificans]|uniref:Uncharacterized protein n=1 Tax=Salmonella enterica subsp. enterica serovar Bovismorbificans TaxID=58097 RepID=A0A655DT33_SALET|nr:Uncharacterised protein [Salmonella enterica subsp. enterica serovar Bovismorbificans]CNU83403.1 Uncharacterised protein [Salmonella enterica subsp. enterica serovar Bovismorbificans]CNV12690.1 Uncharacterised protein [Salmonella enterica subsp. enterica serovar Bovismorbificans]
MLRAGVNQAIRQYQSPFRIGIHDFDILAITVANNIAQFKRVAADQIIGAAQEQFYAFIQPTGNGERQRARYCRRAAHIGFH